MLWTHNLDEAEKLADQIAIIRRGRIISQGSTEALKHRLLGPPEFEIRFATPVRAEEISLALGLAISAWGSDWLRYRPPAAGRANPAVLRSLLDDGLPVVSVQEVPRSLEQVYLEIIGSEDQSEATDVR